MATIYLYDFGTNDANGVHSAPPVVASNIMAGVNISVPTGETRISTSFPLSSCTHFAYDHDSKMFFFRILSATYINATTWSVRYEFDGGETFFYSGNGFRNIPVILSRTTESSLIQKYKCDSGYPLGAGAVQSYVGLSVPLALTVVIWGNDAVGGGDGLFSAFPAPHVIQFPVANAMTFYNNLKAVTTSDAPYAGAVANSIVGMYIMPYMVGQANVTSIAKTSFVISLDPSDPSAVAPITFGTTGYDITYGTGAYVRYTSDTTYGVSDFTDYPPFTTYSIYVPTVGIITINASDWGEFTNADTLAIGFELRPDFASGTVTAFPRINGYTLYDEGTTGKAPNVPVVTNNVQSIRLNRDSAMDRLSVGALQSGVGTANALNFGGVASNLANIAIGYQSIESEYKRALANRTVNIGGVGGGSLLQTNPFISKVKYASPLTVSEYWSQRGGLALSKKTMAGLGVHNRHWIDASGSQIALAKPYRDIVVRDLANGIYILG